MVQKEYIDDYLDEDPAIYNQKFFVFSYIMPSPDKNELEVPMFKMRGAYKTEEECQHRISKLKASEKYFNMCVCEVGKWGGLYTNDQLNKMENISSNYGNDQLNDLMKGYKDNIQKRDAEFEDRKETMRKRAEYENSPEGIEELKNKKESPIAVQGRIDFANNEIEKLEKQFNDIQRIKKENELLMKSFTDEELQELNTTDEIVNPLVVDDSGNIVSEKGKGKGKENVVDLDEITEEIDPDNFDINKFNEKFERLMDKSSDHVLFKGVSLDDDPLKYKADYTD